MTSDAIAVVVHALQDGDLVAAERDMLQLVARAPRDARVRAIEAIVYRRLGDHAAAIRAYDLALELAPDDIAILLDYGDLLIQRGDVARALTLYHRGIAVHPPSDAPIRLRLGLALLDAGQLCTARRTLEALADAYPGSPKAWQALGAACRAADDVTAAAAAFDRVAALAPSDPLGLLSRAQIAVDLGHDSVGAYRAALSADPRNGEARIGLSAALLAAGDSVAAIDALRARLRADPGWIEGWLALASMLWRVRGRDAFLSAIEEAAASRPRDPALILPLLRALARAGEHVALQDLVRRARPAIGDVGPLMLIHATALSDAGQFEEADRLFARLAPLNEPSIDLAVVRHALRAGRPEIAADIAERLSRGIAAPLAIPYLGSAWRLMDDSRWQWLEGDPRLTATYALGLSAGELTALAGRLRTLHTTRVAPFEQSLRGGTQTEGLLLSREDPELRLLRAALCEAITIHIAQLPPFDPAHPILSMPRDSFRFSGSWSVRLTDGGFHVAHVHSEGWFSSAFYVALPEMPRESDEQAGWLTLGAPPAELGLGLSPTRTIRPIVGELTLFPSTMWHGTRPFDRGERLTVAFDIKPLI